MSQYSTLSSSSASSSSSSSPQIEQMTNSKIDLYVEGHGIRLQQPKWWMESSSIHQTDPAVATAAAAHFRFQSPNTQDDECDSAIFVNLSNHCINPVDLKEILNETAETTNASFNQMTIDSNYNLISCMPSNNSSLRQEDSSNGSFFLNETNIQANDANNLATEDSTKAAKKRIYTHNKEKPAKQTTKTPRSVHKSNNPAGAKKLRQTGSKKVNELIMTNSG